MQMWPVKFPGPDKGAIWREVEEEEEKKEGIVSC